MLVSSEAPRYKAAIKGLGDRFQLLRFDGSADHMAIIDALNEIISDAEQLRIDLFYEARIRENKRIDEY